jgi:hypothetical protein
MTVPHHAAPRSLPAKATPKAKKPLAYQQHYDLDPLDYLEGENGDILPSWAKSFDHTNTNSNNFGSAMFPEGLVSTIYFLEDGTDKDMKDCVYKQATQDLSLFIIPVKSEPYGYGSKLKPNFNSNTFKNKDGADGSFHSGHTTYEHKPSSTLNLYCGECSFFPQNWRDAKYCLCIRAKLNKVSPKEALKNLKEGNYYQFDDIRDQPKKYSPGTKNIPSFKKIGWPLKPVGDPRLKQNFVDPEYAIKQMEKNNSKAVLIQVSAVVKKVYPHPVNCNLPEKYRTWRVIDPQGNGSGFYKFEEYPREVIWGNVFDGIIEAIQSQPITAPLGDRITNGLDEYPYDNRSQIELPISPTDPKLGSLVDAHQFVLAARRHILYLLNHLGCVDHFLHDQINDEGACWPRRTTDVQITIKIKEFKILFGGHPNVQAQRSAGFKRLTNGQPVHTDLGPVVRGTGSNSELVTVSHVPTLKDCLKPATMIFPIAKSGRNICYPKGVGFPHVLIEETVGDGQAVYMHGDFPHCGPVLERPSKKGNLDFHPAVFCYIDSDLYPRADNSFWILKDPSVMNEDMFRLYAPVEDYAKHIIKPCLALIDVAAEDAPDDVKRQLDNRVKKWFVSLNPQNNAHSDSDPESHKVPEQPPRGEGNLDVPEAASLQVPVLEQAILPDGGRGKRNKKITTISDLGFEDKETKRPAKEGKPSGKEPKNKPSKSSSDSKTNKKRAAPTKQSANKKKKN